jgi:glycosyltransferase involved in cell wall biosynthesis
MDERPPIRVAVFATHPIQYQIPWFCRLTAVPELDLKVFFGTLPDGAQQGIGFDVPFQWDIPLLEGFSWVALENVSRNPGLGKFTGCNTPGIHAALLSWRPHVAILTGWHSLMMFQALWACMRLGIPKIVRGESNALRPRPWYKRVAHRMLVKRFDAFLAIGKANRAFYEKLWIPSDRIFDCPYFVDNERFSASAARLRSERAGLRAKWRIPEDACCFLFAGKLIAKKRPLDLLSALGEAQKRTASIHLLIVGTGELSDVAKRIAARESLPVTFAGFLNQSEISKAYVAADCLVLPSDSGETWGLVVNEAMACGLPAIVSDQVGCGPDLVHEGETGGKFPLGDTKVLSKKLIKFSSNASNLGKMGERAQQLILEKYTVGCAVEGTLAAIRMITKHVDIITTRD